MALSTSRLVTLLGNWQESAGPVHRRLSDRLGLLILDGRVPLAMALPGERDLAQSLGVSRTTVAVAYRTLRDHELIEVEERKRAVTSLPVGAGGRLPAKDVSQAAKDTIDFAHASLAAPAGLLHEIYSAALGQLARHIPNTGYQAVGIWELRCVLADYYTRRDLPTDPRQILITSGAQHALSLLVRTFTAPGGTALVDHPTYPHALRTLSEARLKITPVPLGESGWDVDQLNQRSTQCQIAYLIVDCHNPTGMTMPVEQRQRCAPQCLTIVDETMAELSIDDTPLPPLASFAEGPVVTIGSVSKIFWGGLRVGWVRADQSVIDRLVQVRPAVDLGTPVLEQLAVIELMDQLDVIRPKRIDQLRESRQMLRRSLATALPAWRLWPSSGGVSVWAEIPTRISSRIASTAPEYGLEIAAGPRFGTGGVFERYIRIPYTQPVGRIEEGVRRLALVTRAVEGGDAYNHAPVSVV